MLKDFLVGAQLKSLGEDGFIVTKDNKDYRFKFKRNEGDCCGYTDLIARLLISNKELKNNPIITKVDVEEKDCGMSDLGTITFYGEYKPIARVKAETSSGSGWAYGATVSVVCKPAGVNEIISQW